MLRILVLCTPQHNPAHHIKSCNPVTVLVSNCLLVSRPCLSSRVSCLMSKGACQRLWVGCQRDGGLASKRLIVRSLSNVYRLPSCLTSNVVQSSTVYRPNSHFKLPHKSLRLCVSEGNNNIRMNITCSNLQISKTPYLPEAEAIFQINIKKLVFKTKRK